MLITFMKPNAITENKDNIETDLELFRNLINKTNDAIFVTDPQTGRFIFVNDQACAGLGYDRQELLKMNVLDIETNFPDNFSWQTHVEELRQKGSHILEGIHKRKNGATFLNEANVSYVVLNTREYMVAIVRDITERKQAEEALLISEERLRQSVSVSNLGVFDHDHLAETIYWSPREREIFGWGPDETITFRDFINCIYPEDLERIRAEVRRAHDPAGNGVFAVEHRIIHRDGSIRWVTTRSQTFFSGEGSARRPVRTIGAASDITELKQMEKLLREEKDFSTIIINETPAIICGIAPDGATTFINPAGQTITGYSVEELIGKNWWTTFYPGDEYLQVERLFRDVKEGNARDYEMTLTTRDGNKRTISWSFLNSFDKDGNIVQIIGFGNDITERKKSEAERERLEEQLRQSQKMEAIGTLAGGVAHDFNNILTAVTGYASLVQERLKDETTQGYIREILNAANRAAELTRGLLAFSRKQTISLQQKDLNEVVQNIQKMLARIIGEDIKLKTVLSDKRLPVSVDSVQIDQVLLNLATNARDAMPDGGHLIIETYDVDMDRSYVEAHLIESSGKYAVLTVSDTGIGMDLKTKENIFEPFFTTKGVGKGTGLGLAMVYGIIKQHGGTINVYSEVGKGTTFRIYLPIMKVAAKEEAETVQPIPLGKGEKILIAEDDAQVREILSMSLKKHGYEVIEAGNGEEAVQRFLENRDTTAILLLDVVMPGNNGREAYEKIKRIEPGIKTIFMSGYTDDIISKNGILEEGFDFVSKPINPDALMRKIRDVLDK